MWRYHAFVHDGRCLRHFGNDITSVNGISDRDRQMCLPFFFFIQRIYTHTTTDKCTGIFGDAFQWTFNTVKYIIENSRGEGYGDGISSSLNSLSRT